MPRAWLFMVLVLGCSGGSAAIKHTGAAWIEKITLEGNHRLNDEEVLPRLALERVRLGGRAVDPYQLQLDTERVRQAYIRKGYFDAKVESRVEGETGPQKVIFVVDEGAPAKTRVSITGLPAEVKLNDARKLVALDEDGAFDYEIYDLAKEELVKLVASAGYAYVELDAAVTVDKGIATVRYAFEAGPRCTFGSIQLIGSDGTLRQAVLNRLEFKAGDVYSTAKIDQTQRNLYEMGRFSTVHIEPDLEGDKRSIPVRIVVTPGGRGELRIGGGVGHDSIANEIRGRFGISHIPRVLPLWTFGVDLRIAEAFRSIEDTGELEAETRLRLLGTGKRIDLFVPRLTGEIGAGWDYLTFEAFTMTGPLATLGLSLPAYVSFLQFRLGWAFAYQTFRNISDVLDDNARTAYGLDENRRLGSFQQSIVAELRDVPSNPTKGVYVGLRIAEGTKYAGGEYEFLQLAPDVRLYYPVGPVVLALHGRAGTILGDVPVTERYFAGGATSQRGFPYRALAPSIYREIDGETHSVLIGGTASYEGSAEVRATVGTIAELPIVASVFVDAADVVLDNDDIGKRVPHIAAGVGGGVIIGGFKIRLDIGHRLNRKGPTEPNYAPDDWIPNTEFQIGVGDAF